MRFSTSVRVLVTSLALLVACGEEGDPALETGGGAITTDSGAGYDSGATGGLADSGAWTYDASGLPGGGFAGGDATVLPVDGGTGGSVGGGDGSVGTDSGTPGGGTPGGGTMGGGGGPYVRGPAPTSASASAPGSFKVMSYTSGYRDGPDFADATIWYPTDATPPFAITVVVPGFVSAQSDIATWGSFLASHGIVTMTIGTNSGLDQPDMRAKALLDALKALKEENARAASPVNGKLDVNSAALMGWSMGGGGTLIAASATPELKAAVTMCAWESKKFPTLKVPTLLIASNPDALAQGMSQPFYDSIPASTPKILFEVKDGDHYIANKPANKGGVIGRYGLSWLKVYLEGDVRYKQFLLEKPNPVSDWKSNLTP